MNNRIKIVVSIVTLLLLSACSSNTEDIAVNYVEAWADGDVEELYKMSSSSSSNIIKNEMKKCENRFAKDIVSSYNSIINKFLNEAMPKVQSKLKTDSSKFKIKDELIKLSINYFDEYSYGDIFKKLFEIQMKDFAFKNKLTSSKTLNKFVEDNINISKNCAKEIISIEDYDSINIIDTKESAIDKKTVFSEIIYKDGDSQKFKITFEAINKEWKVTNSGLVLNLLIN